MNKLMFFFIAMIATVSLLTSCDPEVVEPVIGDIHITEDITVNTLWESQYVYYIDQDIDVTNDAILTIQPGTTVKFAQGKELTISYSGSSTGNIVAEGTLEKPILFTSQSQLKVKGDWDGIWLYDGANASKFKYCKVECAGDYKWSGGSGAITLNQAKNVAIDNCTFEKNDDYGVRIYQSISGLSSFTYNTFIDNTTNDLKLSAYNVSYIGTGNVFSKNIEVQGSDIDAPGNVVWHKQNTDYIILGMLNVGSSTGTILKIEAGASLKFSSVGEIAIGYSSNNFGMIEAEGTATERITMTSSATNPSKGDWNGIKFYSNTSNGCIFDYCDISYGGGYVGTPANITFKFGQGSKVTIKNCNISDSEGWGIMKDGTDSSDPTLVNNTFSNNTLGDKNF